MKYTKVFKLCKELKQVYIDEKKNGIQWIGNGSGFYPLGGMPLLDERNIIPLLEIQDNDIRKWTICGKLRFLDFNDMADETEIGKAKSSIVLHGTEIIPFFTTEGVKFIAYRYLAPISDEDELEYYERKINNEIYIAVKTGIFMLALIKPFVADNQEFIAELEKVSKGAKFAFEKKEREQKQLEMN